MTQPTLAQHALDIPRSGIRDVFDQLDSIPDVISLCVGEPSDTAAQHIVDAACRSIQLGKTKYTNAVGIDRFRQAAAAYTSRVKGLVYNPDCEIQAVDGATMGLFLALKAVVDPGDEVIIPSPFFTSYDAEVMLCGGVPVTIPLRADRHMQLDADDIEDAITPRTRAVIINSPGNPSGAVTPAEELDRIAQVCRRHGIWAISDEVYHSFVFDNARVTPGTPTNADRTDVHDDSDDSYISDSVANTMPVAPSIASATGMKERTIVVDSLSKTFAMTGWRIGYLLAPAAIIEQTGKIAELMHSSVNATAQYAGAAALDGPMNHVKSMRESYRRKRQIVLDPLEHCTALDLIEPQGAFYAFIDITRTGMSSQEFSTRLLNEQHVAVVPGDAFGKEGEGFIRLSYAGDARELREGVSRLRTFAEDNCAPLRNRHTRAFHHIVAMA